MKWLIAMECSAVIRDALRRRGHDAWSCDVKPCEGDPRWHIQDNVFSHYIVHGGWDGLIAHPDCTFLTSAGARHMSIPWRREAQLAAVYNVRALWAFPVRLKAIENPQGRLSTLWRKPDQIIQPHMFGHPEFKATCWWLDGLPSLVPTNQLEMPKRGTREYTLWNRVHRESPIAPDGTDRKTRRSRTLQGIADAIADQWGAGKPTFGKTAAHSLAIDIAVPGYLHPREDRWKERRRTLPRIARVMAEQSGTSPSWSEPFSSTLTKGVTAEPTKIGHSMTPSELPLTHTCSTSLAMGDGSPEPR